MLWIASSYLEHEATSQEGVKKYHLRLSIPEGMSKNPINGVDTLVRDGRGFNMTLDAHSFELVHQKTSLSTDDFYNHPEKITDVYHAEMVEMFKKVTGAAHVHVFHHHARAAKDNSDGNGFNTSVAQYRLKVNELLT